MKHLCVFLCALLVVAPPLLAEKVLAPFDFSQGDWALIGVPLHNYKSLPIQKELGTFVTKDQAFMRQIQEEWDLDMTFEDKCDYHYALKIYRDKELISTIKLNLHCGYLTADGLSYEFAPAEFERFKQHAKPISWSRVSFADLDLLKEAIQRLDKTRDVYWYEDVKPYKYPGYFMFSVNGLPWSANLDSLYTEVDEQIRQASNSHQFYLQKYYHVIRGDNMFVRYIVNCDERVSRKVQLSQTLGWRSHLSGRDSLRVVAIGLDEERYWKIMGRR